MRRYCTVRRRVCSLIKEVVELGPYPVNVKESDALCEVIARRLPPCQDIVAVLDDVLAARGVQLAEGSDGQWGWLGIRVRSDVNSHMPS